jgi:6-phosphogluconolactonase
MLQPLRCLLFLIACLVVRAGFAGEPLYLAYVSGNSNTVQSYTFTAAATTPGTMLASGHSSNLGSPSGYLAWSPDRTKMYGLRSGNQVGAYAIDPATGALTAIGTPVSATGASGPTHLCVHPSGKWVFVAYYTSGHVASFPVKADGSLDSAVTNVVAGVKAHMVLTNQAGTRLYVPCLGSDHIAIYQINQTTGVLTANAFPVVTVPDTAALPNLPGPRHLDFNRDETRAYVINELESSMTTFVHNPSTGALTSPVTVTTLPAGYTGANTCAHVLVSDDDRTLYGSNRGHDSIVSYRIGSTGALTLLGHDTDGDAAGGAGTVVIRHPRDFALDPSGTVLLVANRDTDNVALFRVTPASGALDYIGLTIVADAPTFVAVMPNRSVLSSLVVAPATVGVATGVTQAFTVAGRDQFGAVFGPTPVVTWSVLSGGGTVSTAGVFTAPTTPGTTIIQASDGTRTATATITVTAAGGGGASSGGGGGGCGAGGGIASLVLTMGLLLLAGWRRLR